MECKHCSSKFGYVRLNKQQWICRSCGQITEIITPKKALKNFAGIKD